MSLRSTQRKSIWWGVLLFAGLTMLLVSAGSVTAHSGLIGTDPLDGSVVPEQPSYVTLTFNEDPSLIDGGLQLFDSSGTATTLETIALSRDVRATLPEGLADGTYVVGWRVISADGHPISGAMSFSIGAAGAAPVVDLALEGDRFVERLLSIVQGLMYAGLLASTGLLIFRQFVLPRKERWPEVGGRITVGAAVLSVVASVMTLPLTIARQQGDSLSSIVSIRDWAPDVGRDQWIATIAIGFGLLLAIVVAPRLRWTKAAQGLTLLSVGMAIASPSMLGHTRIEDPRWLIVSSNLLHTVAGAIWFGGLIGLGLVLKHRVSVDGSKPEAMPAATVIARFSTLAGVLVALLGVSGVINGWIIVGGLDPLTSTDYGRLLLVKTGSVIVIILLAAWNRYRLVPAVLAAPEHSSQVARLRRTVAVEAGVIVAVLLITGFLVNQSPQATAAPPVVEVEQAAIDVAGSLGHGTVSGSFAPGVVGTNQFTFQLLDHMGRPLTPYSEPRLQLTLPSADLGPFEITPTATGEPGTYAAAIDVPLSGDWELAVVVRVSMFEEPIARVVLTIP